MQQHRCDCGSELHWSDTTDLEYYSRYFESVLVPVIQQIVSFLMRINDGNMMNMVSTIKADRVLPA